MQAREIATLALLAVALHGKCLHLRPMKTPRTTMTKSMAIAAHSCFWKCAITRRRIIVQRPSLSDRNDAACCRVPISSAAASRGWIARQCFCVCN